MDKSKRKRTSGIVHCALCIAFVAAAASADTDICGNEIRTYTDGGETKTYQFIVSGDPRPGIGAPAIAAASHNRASNDDVALMAIFKSAWASIGGALRSIPWLGTVISLH